MLYCNKLYSFYCQKMQSERGINYLQQEDKHWLFSFFSVSYDKKYENILDDPNSKLGKVLNYFLYFLVLLFCLVATFESVIPKKIIAGYILYFEIFISIIFLLEYIYRWVKSQHKLTFFIQPMRIIDFLSFAPFFISLLPMFGFITMNANYFVFMRMIKSLRVLKLLRNIPLTSSFIRSISYYKDEFKAILVIYFTVLFVGSTLVYSVEHQVNPEDFSSIPQSLWWGLVTMTSLGYGDIIPVTAV